MTIISRYRIIIEGVVQGVGFRPFVFNLAKSLNLTGIVFNSGSALSIEIEGEKGKLAGFIDRIKTEAPPLAHLKSINIEEIPVLASQTFEIEASHSVSSENFFVSPDVAICLDCASELFTPDNRRYRYPFINCTQCGPRFTIIENIPYDRMNTTMSEFEMCPECHQEYSDPTNRRYHAQPVSCFQCGPSLCLRDQQGQIIETPDIINYLQEQLLDGKIVAVKGIGGYHLVCDAKNETAVTRLRQRKNRDQKPFALMAKDYPTALKYCQISECEQVLLESAKSPIVLLKKRNDSPTIPVEIAPRNSYLGMMLPYTPLHLLLFGDPGDNSKRQEIDLLVVTSGNTSNEPLFFRDQDALEGLKNITDFFLTHNRDILIGMDDSVTRIFREKEYPVRRARGYVPLPVEVKVARLFRAEDNGEIPNILACGAELKNTFCINRGDQFYLSHHLGDLQNIQTYQAFENGIEHFQKLIGVSFEAVAHDLHPDYLSTGYAKSMQFPISIPIQHHQAHVASCMAENGLNEEVIGVAFDGTGYGEDGHIWGGEFFTGSYEKFIRRGYFDYSLMPGGEAVVKEPWRMALSHIFAAGLPIERTLTGSGIKVENVNFFNDIQSDKIFLVFEMLKKRINSPQTSSAGRLFDAVSALIGLKSRVEYEGQAAIELEHIAVQNTTSPYPYKIEVINDRYIIQTTELIRGIVADLALSIALETVASKFHETMAVIVLELCVKLRRNTGLAKVVISGGVFQNMVLLGRCCQLLEKEGFKVYTHNLVPTNDGGLSLGQSMMALGKLSKKSG